MTDTRGVFSLRLLNLLNSKGKWEDLNEVWVSPSGSPFPNTGYFGGGQPGPRTTMDKVTYASDTTAAVPGAFLSVGRSYLAATGNSTAGYFGGGFPTSSTMDKVTYASDTTAAVPGAALSAARRYLAATGSSTAGYFGGGFPGPFSTMDKVTYSSDTTVAVPGAALSVARRAIAASSARANALPTSVTAPVPVIV